MSPYNLDTPIEDLPFPVQRLTNEERDLWLLTYVDVFEQTGDVRKAEASAWGAVKRDTILRELGMKSVDGKTIIGGWSNLFTDEENLDLVGTYFDDKTEYALDYYQSAPLLYEHDAGYGIIGKRTYTEVFPHGIWMEHELHKDSPIFDKIISELNRGVLYYSTDSISHVVEVGYEPEDSRLGLWFLAGCSLTQNPAEPGLGPVTFTGVVNAIKSAQGNRVDSADDATTSVNHSQSVEEQKMFTLQELALMLGLPEEATEDEVKIALQALIDANKNRKMDGEYDEDDPEASRNLEILNLISSALSVDGQAPSAEELQAMLESALATLTVSEEPPMEEFAIDEVRHAQATKSVFDKLKNSRTAVTRYQGIAHDPKRHQTGVKQRGGSRGFGTPLKGLTARKVIADGLIAIANADQKALKSLGYTVGQQGGWLVNREVSEELIPFYYASAVTQQAGARIVPMNGFEVLDYNTQITGATAYWGGEGQTTTDGSPTYGRVQLSLREAIAEVTIANRLLKNSSVSLEQEINEDLQKAISLLLDLSALRGSGGKPTGSSGREFQGILNVSGVTKTTLGTGNGKSPQPKDFVDAWGRIEDANVPMSDKWGIVCAPRTHRFLRNTTDTTGQLIPDVRFTQGHPVYATTQIPTTQTVGTSSDCTEVYFGSWEHLYFGIGQDIEFVTDYSVNRKTRQVLIQAVMMADVCVSHPIAFQVLQGVRP